MTDQQTVETLLAETERLHQVAIEARREAEAKEREYRAAALEWYRAEKKEKADDSQ